MPGTFDFLDPCKGVEAKFDSTTAALRSAADEVLNRWDAATEPPDELKSMYVEAVRESMYQKWRKSSLALIEELEKNQHPDETKKFFFNKVYGPNVPPEKEKEIVDTVFKLDYAAKIRPELQKQREALEVKISDSKKQLDEGCKPDVFNQLMRATLGNVALVFAANKEAAENEKGDIAKGIRMLSGISIGDIAKFGLLGGPDSELNKLAGNIGLGPGSDLRKALDEATKVLSPLGALGAAIGGGIKIDPPKIDWPEIKIDWPKF